MFPLDHRGRQPGAVFQTAPTSNGSSAVQDQIAQLQSRIEALEELLGVDNSGNVTIEANSITLAD